MQGAFGLPCVRLRASLAEGLMTHRSLSETYETMTEATAIPVLDKGEVRLIDSMASDLKVVASARVSTNHNPSVASKGTEADAKLIGYLMTHGHGTPFEHAVFQWFIKAPIFVVREWQRHRIASYNEQSGRYSELEPEFYVPDHIRKPDPDNKQGSITTDAGDPITRQLLDLMAEQMQEAFYIYQALLKAGTARELARMVLPVGTYTKFWFTINARSLMNFLELRNHDAAQWEIRQYAIVLEKHFEMLMPLTHAAFVANGRKAP